MSATRKCFLIRLVAAILLAGLLPSSGCSVLLHTAGDPFGYEPTQGPPRCMRPPVGPVVDFMAVLPTFLAGALVGAAEAWGSDCEEEPCTPVDHSTSGKIMLASAGLLLSGVYGIVQTSRCYEAYERYRAHQAAVKDAPGGRW